MPDTSTDSLFTHVRFYTIIGLIILTLGFLVVDRLYPRDSVDQQTVKQMTQVVNQVNDITNSLKDSAASFNKNNQLLTQLLEQRGTNREELYQHMLDQYSNGDSARLRPPSNTLGSQH